MKTKAIFCQAFTKNGHVLFCIVVYQQLFLISLTTHAARGGEGGEGEGGGGEGGGKLAGKLPQ